MGSVYNAAADRLIENEEDPIARRKYEMLLLEPKKAVFDAEHATIDAVLEEKGNLDVARAALRTQVIKDPTRAVSAGDMILQFFAQDPNQTELLEGGHVGVIYQVDGEQQIPLFFVNKADMYELVHGAGFSTAIRPVTAAR